MAKLPTKAQIRIKVNIQAGPASPAQKREWTLFWQKVMAEVKAGER